LSAARDAYDVVLIDTGPVLGSVEATVMAPEADGVLFTIARGQERHLVDRSLQQLGVVGAKVAGFIFNLAECKDWRRSTHGSSIRSVNGSGTGAGVARPQEDDCEFGPLVRAVTLTFPALN
jgi:Mrp family chromosome partitioning ATPase